MSPILNFENLTLRDFILFFEFFCTFFQHIKIEFDISIFVFHIKSIKEYILYKDKELNKISYT